MQYTLSAGQEPEHDCKGRGMSPMPSAMDSTPMLAVDVLAASATATFMYVLWNINIYEIDFTATFMYYETQTHYEIDYVRI